MLFPLRSPALVDRSLSPPLLGARGATGCRSLAKDSPGKALGFAADSRPPSPGPWPHRGPARLRHLGVGLRGHTLSGSGLEPLRLTLCSPKNPQRVINGPDSYVQRPFLPPAPPPPTRLSCRPFGDLSECQALSRSELVPRVPGSGLSLASCNLSLRCFLGC